MTDKELEQERARKQKVQQDLLQQQAVLQQQANAPPEGEPQ